MLFLLQFQTLPLNKVEDIIKYETIRSANTEKGLSSTNRISVVLFRCLFFEDRERRCPEAWK